MQSPAHQFEIRDGVLCKLDTTGAVVRTHRPVGTRIVQLLPLGDRIVVREDYYQFPRGTSNVYCLDAELQRVWAAELPAETDVYANPVVQREAQLSCASWDGSTCTIDPATGRITHEEFTK
jgi:hypothetical protein